MSGSNAVVHHVVRAGSVAAIFFADKFVAPLRLFDFADDRGDQTSAIKLHAGALHGFHGLRVADECTLHVVNAEAVDHSIFQDGFRLVADAR